MTTATTYVLDGVPGIFEGVTIDLTREQLDVFGHRWEWTGETAADGEPLMRALTDRPDIAGELLLSEVYQQFGPLIPAPRATTTDLARTVLRASYAGDDVLGPPLPVRPVLRSPAATLTPAPAEEPKPADAVPTPSATPSTFARLLARLRGGAR